MTAYWLRIGGWDSDICTSDLDRYLLPIGRGEGIELEYVLADRQFPVMGRPGDRPVDVGEGAPAFLVPGPDPRRNIGCVGHEGVSLGKREEGGAGYARCSG